MMSSNDVMIDTPDFAALAKLGFSVFPMPRGQKTPSGSWKQFQTSKPATAQVADWQGEVANVAVVTGRISNLLVIDVDSAEAQKLIDSLDLPRTPTVKTSKGRHYYFQHPDGEVRNKVNLHGVHLDLRGEGGYVVGPGSQHPDGSIYCWEVSPNDCPPAILPAGMLEKLLPTKSTTSLVRTSGSGEFIEAGAFSVWINRETQEAIAELRNAEQGERNNVLFRVAARLANHAAALDLDWSLFAAVLRPEAKAKGLSGSEVAATLESAWKTGSQTPTAWIEIARSWIFVASRNRFWSPRTKQELLPAAFSMNFAEVKPYETGNLAAFLTEGGLIERVVNFRFDPAQPKGMIEIHGERFYNRYCPSDIETEEGDWTQFEEFVAYLIPEPNEREHLLKMIAWTIANPGQKLSYALLLQSKKHGVGKTTLIEIWRKLLGYENTRKTNSQEMDSQYQSYLANTLLVVLEELNLGQGIGVYNRLKDMITGETAIINEKYIKAEEVPNYANFVFLSNLDAPLLIEHGDRRFFVIDSSAEPRPDDYWDSFYEWKKGNLGVIKAYFESIDLSDFKPHAPPPITAAKEQLKRQSETPLAQELRELLDQRKGPFCGDIFTLAEVRSLLRLMGMPRTTPNRLSGALKELGCLSLGQHRIAGGTMSFWAARDTDRWQKALPEEIRGAYRSRPLIVADNDNDQLLEGQAS